MIITSRVCVLDDSMTLLSDRIIATRIEWIATNNPPGCHETAFDNSIFIYSLIAIVGAGGVEAAGILG
jgi:hypothetical protein